MLLRFFTRKKSEFRPSGAPPKDASSKSLESENGRNGTYLRRTSGEFLSPVLTSPSAARWQVTTSQTTTQSPVKPSSPDHVVEVKDRVAITAKPSTNPVQVAPATENSYSSSTSKPNTNFNQTQGKHPVKADILGNIKPGTATLVDHNRHPQPPGMTKDPRRVSFSTPASPSRPEIRDQGDDWVRLSWEPPESDGGLQVTSYHLEKKDSRLKVWLSVAVPLSATDTGATVRSLRDDSSYEFRVSAANRCGKGPPSPSVPLVRCLTIEPNHKWRIWEIHG